MEKEEHGLVRTPLVAGVDDGGTQPRGIGFLPRVAGDIGQGDALQAPAGR